MHDTSRFSEKTVHEDPFVQFDAWYNEHLSAGTPIPETVFLATSSESGRVSLRTVLLKDHDKAGFVFYTNYESRKALQLEKNKNAAILFYWSEMNRQVRIEGRAEKVTAELSEEYFRSRPRESQLAAWASSQSSEIPGREYLLQKFEDYMKKFEGQPVPRPAHWGGFRIIPEWFEFWEDRPNRLHDRITYTREKNRWVIRRLAP